MVEVWVLTRRPPRMATAAMPRIATATTSSIRVSPRSSRWGALWIDMSHVDLPEDAVHRRDQRDRDEADDQPHQDDDERLEERGELGDFVVELGLVVLRRHRELGVERTGVLPDPQHRGRRAREQAGAGERSGHALALQHLLGHFTEPPDIDPVA